MKELNKKDLKSKVVYGLCDVNLFWTENETPDGSDFCTLVKVLVGIDTQVELPVISEDERKYWSKHCSRVSGLSHHFSMKEAILDDIYRLEKYTNEDGSLNMFGVAYLNEVEQGDWNE